ncbi:OsmC family peroxiredoxin [bacterium]|nr:OsmC family peroxiredoxin [bacterium]
MDKSKELTASVRLINDKLNFAGTVEGNAPVSIDYTPPLGDNQGYTSLELLLLSLSSCLGSSALTFLRRMGKTITYFEIRSKGFRKQEHPTGFSQIIMELDIKADNLTEEEVDKVVRLSEATYCPVWSMLKGNVTVDVKYNITR